MELHFSILRRLSAMTITATLLCAWLPSSANATDKIIEVGTLKVVHGVVAYFYDLFATPGYTIHWSPQHRE